MRKSKFSESQIVAILKEGEAGLPVAEVCRKRGINAATWCRHEVLDAYLFKTVEQVQHITEDWLRIYNEQHPHDALGGLPPKQFLPRLTTAAESSNRPST